MPGSRPESLRQALIAADVPATSLLDDGSARVGLAAALAGSCFRGDRAAFAGRSVLVATRNQIEAALALIDLDGLARRLVLLPGEVKPEHLAAIVRDAEVDAIVCSDPRAYTASGVGLMKTVSLDPAAESIAHVPVRPSEWLMLTSGTTGDPKIAVHSLAGLTGAIPPAAPADVRPVWATFYDIRRYGGLQIFLRALWGGSSLVLSQPGEAIADHLGRLAAAAVTHVSGTPSHWRRALMSPAAAGFRPSYVRLSGEIADQAILDALRQAYPEAAIGHAYASTEAGVGFDVTDGREGFPASYLAAPRAGVELRLADGALQIRSDRMARHYAGRPDLQLVGDDGWVDTGDMVEIRGERCHFTGRRGGIINVGGLKVHPEEIESVINSHGAVRQSRVRSRKSPIIGAIVVADVMLREANAEPEAVKQDILDLCRSALPAYKVPAMLNVVAAIDMTAGGKVSRHNA